MAEAVTGIPALTVFSWSNPQVTRLHPPPGHRVAVFVCTYNESADGL